MEETVIIEKAATNTSHPSTTNLRSRRNSRTSIKEEYQFQGATEMEDLQRAQMSLWEKVSSRSQSSSSSESDASSILSKLEAQRDTSKPVGPILTDELASINISPIPFTSPIQPALFPSPPQEGRPLNFGVVIPGVYRSGYPKPHDYEYIKGLQLKTVVTLVKKDEFDEELHSFVTDNGIKHIRIYMQGTKKEAIPLNTMTSILQVLFNQENQPALLHCNQGKHRTGCVVAVARKLSGWELSSVLDEYRSYALPKIRECDVDYITTFKTTTMTEAVVPARFSHMQVRNFLRALLFSGLVMVIWFVSGTQINAASVSSSDF